MSNNIQIRHNTWLSVILLEVLFYSTFSFFSIVLHKEYESFTEKVKIEEHTRIL
jgi:hypothetical protein